MPEETDYRKKADSDAADAVENFMDEIVEALMDSGEAPRDITEYSESYHHETHVDRSYSLIEAAHLLDDLNDYEETDEGLWEGQAPRDAVVAQAAWTYGNAVYSIFTKYLEDINSDANDIWSPFLDKKRGLEGDIEQLEEAEGTGAQVEAVQKAIEALEKKTASRFQHLVFEKIGRRRKPPREGPKEWMPS